MNIIRILVKYYNRKMLMTVDISALLAVLFEAYHEDISVEFQAMSESERQLSSHLSDHGIVAVDQRFQVIELCASGARRRTDLEVRAIAVGQK